MSLCESDPIESVDDLVRYYSTINPEKNLAVGIEWERSGVYRDTLKPVRYEGKKGYLAVLQKLVDEVGWEITEGNRDFITELKRGNCRITVEADGRLELSGSPDLSLHNLAREFRIHAHEVREMGDIYNIGWLPLGWQPFHSAKEISLISKKRYKYEIEKFGDLLEQDIKKNNGFHVNVSYTNEENGLRKAQTAFRVVPIIDALFASSALDQGKVNGYQTYRRYIVSGMCPSRNNMPSEILDEDFSFEKWISFNLNKPVIYFKREGQEFLPDGKITFREWIEKGYEGMKPTFRDFDMHVKTLWTDVRLRPGYLEYRIADSVPFWMTMSYPALMKGLLFDSESWKAVKELTKNWNFDTVMSLEKEVWKNGLDTEIEGKKIMWYARELIHLADEKLKGFARHNGQEEDESIFLESLKKQIYIKEKNLAQEITERWKGDWQKNPNALIDWCEESDF